MIDAYTALDSLRRMIQSARDAEKESLARGRFEGEDGYREHVGRAKALQDVIDKINAQIKSLNGGNDDEAESRFK